MPAFLSDAFRTSYDSMVHRPDGLLDSTVSDYNMAIHDKGTESIRAAHGDASKVHPYTKSAQYSPANYPSAKFDWSDDESEAPTHNCENVIKMLFSCPKCRERIRALLLNDAVESPIKPSVNQSGGGTSGWEWSPFLYVLAGALVFLVLDLFITLKLRMLK